MHKQQQWMGQFDYCWIPDDPDVPDVRLAGGLVDDFGLPENTQHIGLLSRFSKWTNPQQEIKHQQ